jgi:hypothetical protein
MTASKQSQDGMQFHPDLPVPDVRCKTPNDGQIRCPKHAEFYNRINLVN